jgi:hypothetical protein
MVDRQWVLNLLEARNKDQGLRYVGGGTHWVEAFVVKDNTCVARSGRKLVKVWH